MREIILSLMLGFMLDCLIGDPEWFWHPVRLIGKWIAFMEKRLRARGGDLRRSALWLTASTLAVTMVATTLLLWALSLCGRWPLLIGMALVNWTGLSMKCLAKEARGVKKALTRGVAAGRGQVGRIVGRDTRYLTEAEVIKATVETVAENTSDGVISPMLYSLIGGPILMMGFKAASTLDSMVGYLDGKYRDIGWSSARLDDALNFIPARLTALLLCAAALLTGQDAKNALRTVKRDHANHKSPNCAWPEAAAAGALHIQLGGTHFYRGERVEKPTIGDNDRAPESGDIDRINRMMVVACALLMLAIGLIGWAIRY